MTQIKLIIFLTFFGLFCYAEIAQSPLDIPQSKSYHYFKPQSQCGLPENVIQDIQSYQPSATRIAKYVKGPFKGYAWESMAQFVDTFPGRSAGSKILEKAFSYLKKKLISAGLQNVKEEITPVMKWTRGKEFAEILTPMPKKIRVIGLGTSVPTEKHGVTAQVIVVHSLEEVESLGEEKIQGKIVVFNYNITYYDEASGVIRNAASVAAKFGAVAALTKSVTKVSLGLPHAKVQRYQKGVKKIPVASITVEDTEYMDRMTKRGHTVKLHLVMRNKGGRDTMSESRNIVGELKGHKNPEEIVVISGHGDSWDQGSGAQDDAVGIFMAYHTLKVLMKLGLAPTRRTIRTVFWTGEEVSDAGAEVYYEKHRHELENHNVMLEADSGCFKPMGFWFSKSPEVGCILEEITKLFPWSNTKQLIQVEDVPSDLDLFNKNASIPTVSLIGNDGKYFWYHHTESDTASSVNSDDLDSCLAVWAITTYVLSDMETRLPRVDTDTN